MQSEQDQRLFRLAGEQTIECQRPMDAANFFAKLVCAQKIAYPAVGSHDTKRDTASA
jgi:hypothetical protein